MPKAQYLPLIFPQELLDIVLDYVIDAGDIQSLATCALAHRCLRHKSQQAIFQHIKLRLDQPQQTFAGARPSTSSQRLSSVINSAPHLASPISTLEVIEEPSCTIPTALPALLTRLSHLTRLDLAKCTRRVVTDMDMDKILGMATLEELALTEVTVPLDVYGILPRLRRLVCHDILWTHPRAGSAGLPSMILSPSTSTNPLSTASPPTNTALSSTAPPSTSSEYATSQPSSVSRHLTISGNSPLKIAHLVLLLRSFPGSLGSVTSLNVSGVQTKHLWAISCLIDQLNEGIEQLELACPRAEDNIVTVPPLSAMPKLRDLMITSVSLHPAHKLASYRWMHALWLMMCDYELRQLSVTFDITLEDRHDEVHFRQLFHNFDGILCSMYTQRMNVRVRVMNDKGVVVGVVDNRDDKLTRAFKYTHSDWYEQMHFITSL
ncbi:hypothetical protein BD626DRAFT_634991 [Schizophyllum amplum]|uniref:F-box domain-containing protein n=1 Tax=Schizophyllum amplum TaxID=97359 RepID=A0A550BXH0_9AGAR|nr:hypothetical protein BD626DRAFT_634991 [Auriculariopsis ampla]